MMENWLKISLLLCMFGFFKEIRPSEPYVTHYLLEWKNLTQEQIFEEVYPVGTYSNLALLVVVFLVTDLVRYKPVIVAEAVMGIAIWTLLLWGQGIPVMQLIQFLYGGFMAAEVAYYTYIYAKVEQDKYLLVSGHTRAAYLFGRFVSGVLAQVLVSLQLMDYRELNYITLGAMVVATCFALLLPPVPSSLYFHRSAEPGATMEQIFTIDETTGAEEEKLQNRRTSQWRDKISSAFSLIWRDLKIAYKDPTVVKWSIWWALATCGFYQVIYYTQLLWQVIIDESGQKLYNGAVEATYSILGAVFAFFLGMLRLNWSLLGAPVLAVCALVQGAALYVSASTTDLWTAYACYIVCLVAYQALATIASAEIAKRLVEDSYALIFGMNMFIALALQSILTAVVLNWLQIPSREQFVIYGSYFIVLGSAFVVVSLVGVCRGEWNSVSLRSLWLPKSDSSTD